MAESGAFSRRVFLRSLATAAAPAAFFLRAEAICGDTHQGRPQLQPTPAVGEPLKLTPEETAGPFFKPQSPAKTNFRESGVGGTPVRLSGFVFDLNGNPIPGVLLDFWHANDQGEYDFQGYHCRGHQFSDAGGGYALETIVPGLYPGRTRHFHVRLQAPHGSVLSTQLYFPGESRNQGDSLFRADLLLKLQKDTTRALATFNFVIEKNS
jgi:protocatechuate 3,4-dioxygenase beta subunit